MSDIIKVGVVGAGGNTVLKHIPLLQKIDGVEIVSVANRSIKSSSAVASQFEIKNYYDNDFFQLKCIVSDVNGKNTAYENGQILKKQVIYLLKPLRT